MKLEHRRILGIRVDATSYPDATDRILAWAARSESRYVCLGVVASIMDALESPAYRSALDQADLVTPDGMPLVWMLRALGLRRSTRVYGPDLTLDVLQAAQQARIPVGFYGSTPEVLDALIHHVRRRVPELPIVFHQSPPFRPPTPQEDDQTIAALRDSGARILFVGLGGSKQDLWMASHRGRIPAVMLGVGAAFDFLSGSKPQAPLWMQSSGLEWLFRLSTEPRRLWRRYLLHNPRFAVLACAQLLRARLP